MPYVLDALSIIWAWHTMPVEKQIFESVWVWVGQELQRSV